MQIKQISETDGSSYDNLARDHGTVYNTLAWLKMFGDKVRLVGIYDDGGHLIGGFTIYEEKKFGLNILCDPPFTPVIGPFLKMTAKSPTVIMENRKKVLSLMADFIEESPYSVISLSLDKNIVDTQPFIWKKFKVTPRYKYVLDLGQPVENMWNNLARNRKNEIRKAERDGLVVKQVQNLEIVKSLVLQTFSKQEMTVNEYYLNKILFEFANKNNSFAFATFQDEKPLACFFVVYDQVSTHGVASGYDHRYKHRGGGPLATWGAIQHAKDLGLQCFDFEGSMVPRFEKYLREFGGQLIPYYRVNKAKLPLEIILKFFKRDLF